jgi:hypothetical protein
MTKGWPRAAVIANIVVIALLVGFVLTKAHPSSEAVRLRNALILDVGTDSDFSWTPHVLPADFLVERRKPLPEFVADAHRVAGDAVRGDWAKALSLAAMLTQNARRFEPIQANLLRTYRAILDEGRGYCADYVDAYLALAHAVGLPARIWAFSFDGFGGHGHAFVEVFDRSRQKWLFLDVYNNVHATDAISGEPLSAIEFREFALGKREAPVIRRNGPSRLGYSIESKLIDYYRRGAAEWYLWWGNNVYSYDAHPAVQVADRLSHSLSQLTAIIVGVHPRIKVLATPENMAQVQRMVRLRWTLLFITALVIALSIILAWQIFFGRRASAKAERNRPEQPAFQSRRDRQELP